MIDIYRQLSQIAETEKDMPLSSMTTLRIGGYARYVVYPNSDIALDLIIRLIHENHLSYKLIGKGSDLLCSDDDYDGIVIRLDRYFDNAYFKDNEVTVQAGCSTVALAVQAMKNGLSGLEFASGIPGTVGGAVFMNAGAYRASMSDIVKEVFIYRNGRLEWIPCSECGFTYRHSCFHDHPDWIILAARLSLTPKDSKEINDLMQNRRERRLASQPLEYPSCGSVFRNPEGTNAWQLIDGIGYRGKEIGGACVSPKHCNFIINKNHATAKDYIQLVEEIQKAVKEKYGIMLETEMEKFNWK